MKYVRPTTGRSRYRLPLLMAALLVGLYLVLLLPDSEPPAAAPGDGRPFEWNQDEYWRQLERTFLAARVPDAGAPANLIPTGLRRTEALLDSCRTAHTPPEAAVFDRLERAFFELAPLLAARSGYAAQAVALHRDIRRVVKEQSRHWDMNSPTVRDRLYRLLYGSRTAVEEILLQAEDDSFPALVTAIAEPSATPSAEVLGVTLHSGDILVSRGGAPTSALIARGNDYPGNFSHVALVHVDEDSRRVSIVEAHIEKGVAIASIDDYLRDTKLRILVLRLRADLPNLIADSLLPHRAATQALRRAEREHIPYDFEMDFDDNRRLFCSEVASYPYSQYDVGLWMGLSRISSPGVRAWLAAFGVTHFQTQEPSDLEYDPQLRVVAEWRDPETLWKDHLDNAVVDVMLEGAEAGDRIGYDRYRLPLARLAKGYSWLLNLFGGVGPVPEGMSATAALKNDWFSKRHDGIKARLQILADDFRRNRGYRPPYWALVRLARLAGAETVR